MVEYRNKHINIIEKAHEYITENIGDGIFIERVEDAEMVDYFSNASYEDNDDAEEYIDNLKLLMDDDEFNEYINNFYIKYRRKQKLLKLNTI